MDLASQFYIQMMVIVRRMYHVCKLVHADLSEWNVLVHKPLSYDTPSSTSNNTINDSTPSAEPQLYVIDVSQSVEHDHPLAFDFLRKDLTNVDAFFKGKRVRTVGLRRGFEWVISEWTEGTSGEEKLKDLMMEDADDEVEDDGSTAAEASKSPTVKDESEYVFMNSYIPRTLNEVYDPERDIELLKKARTMKLDETSKNNPDAQAVSERLLYQQAGIIGIVDSKPSEAAASGSGGKEKSEKEKKGVRFANDSAEGEKEGEGEEGDDASSDEEGSDEDGEGGEGEYKPRMPRGHRHEDKDAKKVIRCLCFAMMVANGHYNTGTEEQSERRSPREEEE
jgi:RIO kinase 1